MRVTSRPLIAGMSAAIGLPKISSSITKRIGSATSSPLCSESSDDWLSARTSGARPVISAAQRRARLAGEHLLDGGRRLARDLVERPADLQRQQRLARGLLQDARPADRPRAQHLDALDLLQLGDDPRTAALDDRGRALEQHRHADRAAELVARQRGRARRVAARDRETRLPDVIGRARTDHEGRHEHHRPRAEHEPRVADDEAGDRSHSAARVRRVTWPMPANLLRVPALSAATTSTPAEPL